MLFCCLILLLRFKWISEEMFSLSLSSSKPWSLILQSSRKSSFNFLQCFEFAIEYKVLLLMSFQLILRFNFYKDWEASLLMSCSIPSSSTEVACRSRCFIDLRKGDWEIKSKPAPVISVLPYKISYSKLCIDDALAKITRESSVIWLSARLSPFKFFIHGKLTNISMAVSVIKLKFCERSTWIIGSGVVICSKSLRV